MCLIKADEFWALFSSPKCGAGTKEKAASLTPVVFVCVRPAMPGTRRAVSPPSDGADACDGGLPVPRFSGGTRRPCERWCTLMLPSMRRQVQISSHAASIQLVAAVGITAMRVLERCNALRCAAGHMD